MKDLFGTEELRNDRGLQLYGALISLILPLAFYAFSIYGHLPLMTKSMPAACWPFFPGCESYRFTKPEDALYSYGLVALGGLMASGFFFWGWLKRKSNWVVRGQITLIAATIGKFALYLLDLRFRHNQALMEWWVLVFFCFGRNRRPVLKLLVVGFYFSASLLKFDRDWVSGLVLRPEFWFFPGWIDRKWLPVACIYVIVLEFALIWGLYFRNRWIFWATVFQIVVFHLMSVSDVGSYYPLLMTVMLSIFLIDRAEDPETTTRQFKGSFKAPIATLGRRGTFWTAFFIFNQVWPKFTPGELVMTAEGRNFGIYMFEPTVICQSTLSWVNAQGKKTEEFLSVPFGNFRDQCDPMTHQALVRNYCKPDGKNRDQTLTWTMRSRRESAHELQTVVEIQDFCNHDPGYRLFGHNPWIFAR